MKNTTYVTITYCRPLFCADHDGNSHFAPELLVFVLKTDSICYSLFVAILSLITSYVNTNLLS